MTEPGTLLPALAALADAGVALEHLKREWVHSDDRTALTSVLQGALAYPAPHPLVALALRLAAWTSELPVDVELVALWNRWESLDQPTRRALAGAMARRCAFDVAMRTRLQDAVVSRPELGEILVPLFLAAPGWFSDHAPAIFALHPQARPDILAAAQQLIGWSDDSGPGGSTP